VKYSSNIKLVVEMYRFTRDWGESGRRKLICRKLI
jgi:hypothetical protein